MSIYTPFTYIIGWSQHKKFYYGCRYAQGCAPSDLWTTYFTSSNEVKKFRKQFGEPDVLRIHRTFSDKDSCVLFENIYLEKVNAKSNILFLNKSNGNKNYNGTGADWTDNSFNKAKNTWTKNHGVENPSQSSIIKEKKKQTCLGNWGVENASQSEEIKEKKKKTCLENWGYDCSLKSPEIKEKIKQTNLEIYGFEVASKSEKVKEKIKLTIENKSYEEKESINEKRKETNLKKFGVEHLSKLQKYCEYCGEYKSYTHEKQCRLRPNKTKRKTGEDNPRSKIFKVTSPENEVTYLKSVKKLKDFAEKRNLKSWTFAKIRKYPGWIIEEIKN